MVASEEQIAAAAAAMALGEQLAAEHWQSAAQTPGVGWQVSLPSAPSPVGPVQGEGFNLPEGTPALSAPQPRRVVPEYGSPEVGGAGYHTTESGSVSPFDGVSWPSPPGPSSSRSSVVHISPRARGTEPTRAATAVAAAQTSAPTSPRGPGATSRRGRLRNAWRSLRGKRASSSTPPSTTMLSTSSPTRSPTRLRPSRRL